MTSLSIKRALAAFIDFWAIITFIFFINWAHAYLDSLAFQMTKSVIIDSPINHEAFKRSKAANFYLIIILVPFIYYATSFFSQKNSSLGQRLLGLTISAHGRNHKTQKMFARAFLHGVLICPMVILGYAFLISMPEGTGPLVETQTSISIAVLLIVMHIPFRGITATDKITNTRITEI